MPVRDSEAASKAMTGIVNLAKVDPFKDALHLQGVTSDESSTTAMFTRVQDAKAKPSGIAWTVADHTLVAAAGHEPAVTLKISKQPARKLGDEPSLAPFVTAIGADACTVAIAQPFKLDPKRAALPTTPLTIAIGRHGTDAFVRIDVPDPLLREAARSQAGF